MKRQNMPCRIVAVAASLLFAAQPIFGEPPAQATQATSNRPPGRHDDSLVLSVEAARERAELMHSIYAATLDVMHHRYFRHDRVTIPARAMEDVFTEIDRRFKIKSSWISANGRAMSIDHEPEGEFELAAVKAIRDGDDQFELVENEMYRRVGAIRLSGGCLNCHGRFGSTNTAKQFAGLVIEIPRIQKTGPTAQ